MPAESPSVCAVVVAYRPDADFEGRLRELLPQVATLVVVDNTPAAERCSSVVLPPAPAGRTCLIENAANLGVGAALNQGLDQAAQRGCGWLLTLDQDSRCYADLVQTLLRVAASCALQPNVIGGNYLDPRTGRTKVPAAEDGCLDQKTVITSGCLVDVRLAQVIGGFRSDFFIDQLDHEFCLRARAHGGRVVISREPVMEHSVGEAGGISLPPFGVLPNHSPLRKYYIARNSIAMIAAYWRHEPDWCFGRLVRLIGGLFVLATLERQRLMKVRAFLAGIEDAIQDRMGPCSRPWLIGE